MTNDSPAPSKPTQEAVRSGSVQVSSPDLFFAMRIRTVLKQLGYAVVLTKSTAEFCELPDNTVLGLIDFNQPVNWLEFRAAIESKLPIIGFGAHTDVAGFRAAKAAGVVRVVSNGEFNRSLPDLVARYRRK